MQSQAERKKSRANDKNFAKEKEKTIQINLSTSDDGSNPKRTTGGHDAKQPGPRKTKAKVLVKKEAFPLVKGVPLSERGSNDIPVLGRPGAEHGKEVVWLSCLLV